LRQYEVTPQTVETKMKKQARKKENPKPLLRLGLC
jgi:hypothetical protein